MKRAGLSVSESYKNCPKFGKVWGEGVLDAVQPSYKFEAYWQLSPSVQHDWSAPTAISKHSESRFLWANCENLQVKVEEKGNSDLWDCTKTENLLLNWCSKVSECLNLSDGQTAPETPSPTHLSVSNSLTVFVNRLKPTILHSCRPHTVTGRHACRISTSLSSSVFLILHTTTSVTFHISTIQFNDYHVSPLSTSAFHPVFECGHSEKLPYKHFCLQTWLDDVSYELLHYKHTPALTRTH